MKKNISDLLDAYGDPNIELEQATPLSSERIKELTMSKIKDETAPKKRRTTFRVLMAAAIIVTLAVSVFAAGNSAAWFQDFFAKQSHSEMSLSQIEYVQKNTAEQVQSQSINGYTVTLDSYITDGSTTYAKIRIEIPETSAVSDVSLAFEDGPWLMKDGEPIGGASTTWKLLEWDEAARAGTYLLRYQLINASRGDVQTGSVELVMTNLVSTDDRKSYLAEGTWRFEVNIPEAEVVELAEEPIGKVEVLTEQGETIEVELLRADMTAMGLRVEFLDPGYDSAYYMMGVWAILEDGTQVLLREKTFGARDLEEGTIRWIYFEPESPTPLEEVMYVEFPGGTRITVSAVE